MESSLVARMRRAARLEVDLYREVEHDRTATSQALLVVLIVGLASALGSALGAILARDILWFFLGMVFGLAQIVFGWLIWSGITLLVGKTLFRTEHTEVDYGQMLRTIGFALSPGVLLFLRFIPVLGGIISFIVFIWILVAAVIAVREAMDFSTGRAIGTLLVGWFVMIIFNILLGVFLLWA